MSYNDALINMDQATRAAIEDNRIDQEEREHNKRVEIISKFANGWERYNKEPLFRNILEAVSRGADVWDIVDKLLDMNEELKQRTIKLLTYGTFPRDFNL